MAIENIGAVANSPSQVTQRAGLGQEDFLNVLLAQLTYQDPLKPLDNNEFIAQFAQMTNLVETQQLNDKLDTLLAMQTSNQAISLIGKGVDVTTATGAEHNATVIAVSFSDGVPGLTVRTQAGSILLDVSLGQISLVRPEPAGS